VENHVKPQSGYSVSKRNFNPVPPEIKAEEETAPQRHSVDLLEKVQCPSMNKNICFNFTTTTTGKEVL
jgi:hypothetical protein